MRLSRAYSEKENKMFEWHEWFAWHPVLVSNQLVWLKTILRKADHMPNPHSGDYMVYYYKLK